MAGLDMAWLQATATTARKHQRLQRTCTHLKHSRNAGRTEPPPLTSARAHFSGVSRSDLVGGMEEPAKPDKHVRWTPSTASPVSSSTKPSGGNGQEDKDFAAIPQPSPTSAAAAASMAALGDLAVDVPASVAVLLDDMMDDVEISSIPNIHLVRSFTHTVFCVMTRAHDSGFS